MDVCLAYLFHLAFNCILPFVVIKCQLREVVIILRRMDCWNKDKQGC